MFTSKSPVLSPTELESIKSNMTLFGSDLFFNSMPLLLHMKLNCVVRNLTSLWKLGNLTTNTKEF